MSIPPAAPSNASELGSGTVENAKSSSRGKLLIVSKVKDTMGLSAVADKACSVLATVVPDVAMVVTSARFKVEPGATPSTVLLLTTFSS